MSADAVGACLLDERSLERGALGADLLEARRDDDRRSRSPAAPHSAMRSGIVAGGVDDDRELDLFGDVAHARMGRDAEDAGRAGLTG